ncbi:MAG: ATP-binding protein [Chitinivibrionales bacterium]|nr:ATP-binding protein [Chitinivibrionales bacterium]
MENPFFFGKTVTGASFINRQKEISYLTDNLGRGQNVIIFSPRRYGKTSLIKHVIGQLSNQKILTFYFDFYRITTLEQFYQYYSSTVIASLQSPYNKIFSMIRSPIPSLRPRLVYSEPAIPSIEVELYLDILKKNSTLVELFDFVEKYCIKKKKKACVVFDEFQEITSIENGLLIEREMRSSMQHHQHVSYAFLGSKYHLMNHLFTDKSRPFYNFGTRFELDTIAQEVWAPYITRLFKKDGYTFPAEACKRLLTYTKGHPYYTQLFASEVWEYYRTLKKIAENDIDKTLLIVLQKESHAFVELWDSLSPGERKVLSALAASGSMNIFSNEFMTRNRLGAVSSVQRIVVELVKRGLLLKKERAYELTDPLLMHWIKIG